MCFNLAYTSALLEIVEDKDKFFITNEKQNPEKTKAENQASKRTLKTTANKIGTKTVVFSTKSTFNQ